MQYVLTDCTTYDVYLHVCWRASIVLCVTLLLLSAPLYSCNGDGFTLNACNFCAGPVRCGLQSPAHSIVSVCLHCCRRGVSNVIQLSTYADAIGDNLADLTTFLQAPELAGETVSCSCSAMQRASRAVLVSVSSGCVLHIRFRSLQAPHFLRHRVVVDCFCLRTSSPLHAVMNGGCCCQQQLWMLRLHSSLSEPKQSCLLLLRQVRLVGCTCCLCTPQLVTGALHQSPTRTWNHG